MITFLNISIILGFFPVNEIEAYTCVEHYEPLEALQQYDTVFAGEVIEMKQEKVKLSEAVLYKMLVTFRVSQSWKGSTQDEINVVGRKELIDFKVGEDYLVYANSVNKDHQMFKKGEIAYSVCSGTVELVNANYDLQQLGTGKLPYPQLILHIIDVMSKIGLVPKFYEPFTLMNIYHTMNRK